MAARIELRKKRRRRRRAFQSPWDSGQTFFRSVSLPPLSRSVAGNPPFFPLSPPPSSRAMSEGRKRKKERPSRHIHRLHKSKTQYFIEELVGCKVKISVKLCFFLSTLVKVQPFGPLSLRPVTFLPLAAGLFLFSSSAGVQCP